MQDINSCVVIGRFTKDVEIRKTQSGKSVVQFTLAVNRRGKDAGADFINCVAWEKTADVIAQYCHKGDRIGIIGRIATRSYDDKYSNKKIFVTEIMVEQVEFLSEGKKEAPKQEQPKQEAPKQQYEPQRDLSEWEIPEDLPF